MGGALGFYPAIGPATLTLGGNTTPQGTLLNTSAVRVSDGGTLILENSSASSGNLANRINDAAAVLTLSSLQRSDGGVMLVRGQNLGNGAVANRAQVLIGGAKPDLVGGGGMAGSTTVSIVPWMVGNYSTTSSTGNATTFVTYDKTDGLRALNPATEFASALDAHASDNVYIVSGTTDNAAVSVNSLVPASGSIAGTGSIDITSGALLYSGQAAAGIVAITRRRRARRA